MPKTAKKYYVITVDGGTPVGLFSTPDKAFSRSKGYIERVTDRPYHHSIPEVERIDPATGEGHMGFASEQMVCRLLREQERVIIEFRNGLVTYCVDIVALGLNV